MEILPPKYQKYRMFPQLQQNDENEQMQKALEFSGELLILQARLYPIPNFEYEMRRKMYHELLENLKKEKNSNESE